MIKITIDGKEYNMLKQALEIVKKLRVHGHEAVFAGGYVRDMILNRD